MRFTYLILLFFVTNSLFSQTIVSTNPENKNAILEEFTGIHCGWCPDGHVIAQGILNNHPDDAFVINIHTGGYSTPSGSEPDFRTSFGSSLAGQAGANFFPSGNINRHIFSGSTTVLGRGEWVNASNQILAQSSYVNVGVEAELNLATREITIHVETYYTADSPESINKLNVVLLQDSTIGYQSSGGSNYNHMHRLVHMLTGQWGEDILTTSTGSFIDKTYTYTFPTEYNEIPVILNHLKVVAFVSENHQEIISGYGTYPTYTGSVSQNDVAIESITIPDEVCETNLSPKIKIRNMGEQNLTSLQIEYSVNGGDITTYNWTGNLEFSKTQEIELDEINFVMQENNVVNITAKLPNNTNDENFLNNVISGNFNEAFHTTTNVNLELNPGPWGFEISWKLFDNTGAEINSGDGNSGYYEETFTLDLNNCYTFELYDSYGNGFRPGGYCILTGTDNVEIRNVTGDFGSIEIIPFKPTTISGILNLKNNIQIYPNPAKNSIFIESTGHKIINIEIFDLSGKIILSKEYKNISKTEIITESLNSGIYFVNIYTDTNIITRKISVIH